MRLESGRRLSCARGYETTMRLKSLMSAAAVALAVGLAGCTSDGSLMTYSDYGSKKDSGYTIPSIPIAKVDRKYRRQLVRYETKEKPGTVIVDTGAKHLFF